MFGTILADVRAMAKRAEQAPSALGDRLAGVDAGAVASQLIDDGIVRRHGPQSFEHVPTGKTYQSTQMIVFFHEGYQQSRSAEGRPQSSSIEIEVSETGGQFIHEPSGERFDSDLAVQVFESGWEAGRQEPPE